MDILTTQRKKDREDKLLLLKRRLLGRAVEKEHKPLKIEITEQDENHL